MSQLLSQDLADGKYSMKEAAIRLCQEQDSFAAIEHLARQDDIQAATKAFGDVMRHYYWKEKDLARTIAFGRAGVQYGLTAAPPLQATHPERANDLRAIAKGMAYDLASFTWTGWDEAGITISPSDLQIGLDAARTNLRLAVELKKEPLPLSRAHWMLGGHQLAIGQFAEATESFQKAAKFAKEANTESEELLSQGFVSLVSVLQSKGKTGQTDLEGIKQKLKTVKDGEFFIGQIETAYKVFSK